MGYICHNAIIVTGGEIQAEKAYERVARIVNDHDERVGGVGAAVLSPLSRTVINGYRSFAIFPDGGKEGWDISDDGDDLRDEVIDALDDLWVDWCEVRFGDEADMNGMTRCSGEPPQLLPTRREVEESFDAEAPSHIGRDADAPNGSSHAHGASHNQKGRDAVVLYADVEWKDPYGHTNQG